MQQTRIVELIRRPASGRMILAALTQAVNAASNLFLTVWVARDVDANIFGIFSLVYAAVQVAMVAGRSVANMPMMISYSSSPRRFSADLAREVAGASLLVSLVCSALMALVACVTPGARSMELAMAVVMPGLLLLDCYTYLYFTRQQQWVPLRSQFIRVLLQVPALLFATQVLGVHEVWVLVLLWGLATYVAVAVSLPGLGAAPRVLLGLGWIRRNRSTISDLTSMAALSQVSLQGVIWIMGGTVGLQGVAGFRAAQTPFGTLRVLVQGLQPMMLTEGSRLAAFNVARLRMLILAWVTTSAAMGALLGIVLHFLPAHDGYALMGDSWRYAKPVIISVAALTIGSFIKICAQTGLSALKETRLSAKLMPLLVAGNLCSVLLGGSLWGLEGACLALATSSLLGAGILWGAFECKVRTNFASAS